MHHSLKTERGCFKRMVTCAKISPMLFYSCGPLTLARVLDELCRRKKKTKTIKKKPHDLFDTCLHTLCLCAARVLDELCRRKKKTKIKKKNTCPVWHLFAYSLSLRCSVAFEGRVVTVGYASGSIPSVAVNQLLLRSCSIRGVWWGNYAMRHPQAFAQSITDVLDAFKEGKLRPHIGKTFPLEQVRDSCMAESLFGGSSMCRSIYKKAVMECLDLTKEIV